MGLLTKAQLMDQKEKEKKEQGENMSGNFPERNGLLEKAGKYGVTEESESEEGESGGLLEKAAGNTKPLQHGFRCLKRRTASGYRQLPCRL